MPTVSECVGQDKAANRVLTSGLSNNLLILDAVPIDHKDHTSNSVEARAIKTGDKILIRISYDSVKSPIKEVELRFSNKQMSAIEINKVLRDPLDNKDKTDKTDKTDTFSTMVKAIEASDMPAVVAIQCTLEDGTKRVLFFKFKIQQK